MAKFHGSSYGPKYQKNYFDLPWYERYLMSYYEHLKYQVMGKDTNYYFKNKKVVNLDIIGYGCCGDRLEKNYKKHNTVKKENFNNNYPEKEKNTALSSIFITK